MLVLLLLALAGAAQVPAKYFDDNCGMCHAIGGPPSDGAPDLKGVTARRDHTWLVQFILNPEEIAAGDATAQALVKQYGDVVMPRTDGLRAETVEALLRYIDTASGGAAAPAAAPTAAAAPIRTVTAADLAAGREWYDGRRALARRAPACVSCHRLDSIRGLGGGTLGPDLTTVHQRLGGARGLSAWLGNPPTRVMRAVFRQQPLAEDETFAIAAMLADEGARPVSAAASQTRGFVTVGLAIALAALTLMAVVWARRMTAVRRPLVAAARARSGGER